MADLVSIPQRTATNAERHAQLAGAWLLSLSSDQTRRAYRRDLLELFGFLDAIGTDTLAADRPRIDTWRLTLAADSAPTTVARKLAAASSFYSYAADAGQLAAANPVRRVARPHIDPDHSATRGLSKAEAVALLSAAEADGPRSNALVSLLLLTGVRISEALNADQSDLQHDAGHRVLVVTRKGGRRAKIALPAPVIAVLSAYLGSSTATGSEVATLAASTDAPIFTTATGKRWAPSEAFRTVGRLAKAARIEGHVSPHGLRHTHATLALDAGVPLRDLQDSMGHADPRTTRRYDRARGRLERSSAYSVAAALA